ncbi:TetR family transcriptional regulator [Streptosporangiaceae bacterium NEAU-GS5]|nr:TetR family transcriptional regulator [Streptosporangiaceae bacterium NEAU-GS5]
MSAMAWREPQQARSRARVEAILAAADAILAERGYEALTVRRIAETAGVPVGSIYQFFPDKAAIVDALGRHYISGFDQVMEDLVERAQRERLDDIVGTVVDAFTALYRARPGYVALWSGRHLSPELAHADQVNNAVIMEGARRIIAVQLGLPDGPELARGAQIAVWAVDSVLQHTFRAGPRGDQETLEETKRMLRLYLEDLAQRLRNA